MSYKDKETKTCHIIIMIDCICVTVVLPEKAYYIARKRE